MRCSENRLTMVPKTEATNAPEQFRLTRYKYTHTFPQACSGGRRIKRWAGEPLRRAVKMHHCTYLALKYFPAKRERCAHSEECTIFKLLLFGMPTNRTEKATRSVCVWVGVGMCGWL